MDNNTYKREKERLKILGIKAVETSLKSTGITLKTFCDLALKKGDIARTEWEEYMGEKLPSEEELERIQLQEILADELQDKANRGELSIDELKKYYSNQRCIDIISNYKRKQINNRLLNKEELKKWFENNLIPDTDVLTYCKDKAWDYNEINRIPKDFVDLKGIKLPDVHNLTPNYTDVILIGSPGAGKTMFLASLFNYGHKKLGKMSFNSNNSVGKKYASKISNAVQEGMFIIGTPDDLILHTSALVQIEKEEGILRKKKVIRDIPFNFIEMPGENFKKAFDADSFEEWPTNLRDSLKSNNPKILLFTIPCDENDITIGGNDIDVASLYSDILNAIEENGIMPKVYAVALIITKWDKSNDNSYDTFSHIVESKCNLLNNKLNAMKSKGKIQYGQFDFTIGEVDEEMNSYKFKKESIECIYDWLIANAIV